MAAPTGVTVQHNVPPGTSLCVVEIGGVSVARFTYKRGRVTAPARTSFTTSRAEFLVVVSEVANWRARVKTDFNPSWGYNVTCSTALTHETTPDRVRMSSTMGAFTFSTSWQRVADKVTLDARPALDLTWGEALWFFRAHDHWMNEVLSRM